MCPASEVRDDAVCILAFSFHCHFHSTTSEVCTASDLQRHHPSQIILDSAVLGTGWASALSSIPLLSQADYERRERGTILKASESFLCSEGCCKLFPGPASPGGILKVEVTFVLTIDKNTASKRKHLRSI